MLIKMNLDYQTIAILVLLLLIVIALIFIIYRLHCLTENNKQSQKTLSNKSSADIENPPPEYSSGERSERSGERSERSGEQHESETDAIQALMSMHRGNTNLNAFQPDEESITEVEEVESE